MAQLSSKALSQYYNEALKRSYVPLKSRPIANLVSSVRVRKSAEEPPINVPVVAGRMIAGETEERQSVDLHGSGLYGCGMCMGGGLYGAGQENTSNSSKQILVNRANSRALYKSLSNPLPKM
jgi:hypothetical protein